MKRKRLFVRLSLAISVLAVYVMLFHVRAREYKGRHYRCPICGVSASEGAEYFLGIRYKMYEHFPRREETTKEYDELVGVPHEHEWVMVAHTVSREAIWGGARTRHGDRHPLRIRLVRDALLAIKNEFMSSPMEFRRNLFFRLINSQSHDEFYSILEQARSTAGIIKPDQSSEGQSEHEESEEDQQPAPGIEVR